MPIHGGAGDVLVAHSLRPEIREQLGVVRGEFVQAALFALGIGATLGLLIAALTGRRLGRIASAARAIGAGDFDVAVSPGFPDEVGSLALSIERMRDQLRDLFRVLKADRDRLERLLDRLNEGVVLIDCGLNIEFANGHATELLDVQGRLDQMALDPGASESVQQLAHDLFTTGLPTHLRVVNGDQTLAVSGISPGKGGESAVVVVSDESQRTRNERVQREFATNAARELRTPLASVVTAVEMLQPGAKNDPAARDEFLEVIAREADRLTRLTRALLILARAEVLEESPRSTPIQIVQLLEQVANAIPVRRGVSIATICSPTLAIEGNSDLLEQALSSVAVNAGQHTQSGRITLRGLRSNGSVIIEVIDTGEGIPVSQQPHLFERFSRAGSATKDSDWVCRSPAKR